MRYRGAISVRKKIFFYVKPNASMLVLRPTHPHILQWVPSALFPGIKQPRHEPKRFSPSNVEFENLWTYNSTPAHETHNGPRCFHQCNKLTRAALLGVCPMPSPKKRAPLHASCRNSFYQLHCNPLCGHSHGI
jgi:hypothetical protein